MAIDFDKPVEGDGYNDDVLTTIRDNIEAIAIMAHTGGSNIPTNTKRLNTTLTPPRFQNYNGATWDDVDLTFASGTIALFGNSTAPVGWTRKGDWADNAMLTYKASGTLTTGGTANPKDGHTHTGPSHTHGMSSHTHSLGAHTHSGPSHTHGDGTLQFRVANMDSSSSMYFYNSGGSSVKIWDRNLIDAGSGVWGAHNIIGGGSHIFYTSNGSGNTGSGGTGNTGTPSSDTSGTPSVANTAAGGTAATGQNTTPIYQEVIAASKD